MLLRALVVILCILAKLRVDPNTIRMLSEESELEVCGQEQDASKWREHCVDNFVQKQCANSNGCPSSFLEQASLTRKHIA